jgi:DHA3 family macrolide efflux protein-like MFS transporter
MILPSRSGKFSTFVLIWIGQFASILGSGLTQFAVGVWVYQTTGSATQFALILVALSIPTALVTPFAGVLVDRWNRRIVMIISDTGVVLSSLSIAILYFSGHLAVWHIYLAAIVGSVFGTLQWPAFSAATSQLVPKKHLGRASGMVQTSGAIGQIVTPIVAGYLFYAIGLGNIILIDFATYLFANLILLFIRIPDPQISEEGLRSRGSLWKEAGFGWRYLLQRRGLLALLSFYAVVNMSNGFFSALFTPMVLSMSNARTLGAILSVGGVGVLLGSVVMGIWGGPKRRIRVILGLIALEGVFMAFFGFTPSILLVGIALFLFQSLFPIVNGCSQAVWQSKVDLDVQGRVFAARQMISQIFQPLAFLMAGPLADHVFEPAFAPGGSLAGSIGRLTGIGAGRGIGFLFTIMGVITIIAALIAWSYPRLRNIEHEIPDAISETAATTTVP